MSGVTRLLVADVDGTLVTDDKRLTTAAVEAAGRLRDAGIALALTSSRPPHGLEAFAKPLGLETPRGAFNGGMLIGADGSILQQMLLAEATVRQAITRLAGHRVDLWLFTADAWILNNPDGHYVPLERATVKLEPTVVDDFAPYLGRLGKLMASSEDFAALAEAEAELQREMGGQVAAHLSQRYYLDVTHPDANKGRAVRDIAELLGIALDETACIGDMTNDVPMFDVAAFSIAMGNAPDAVKARATATTRSNQEEGFAHAVETLLLPRAPSARATRA